MRELKPPRHRNVRFGNRQEAGWKLVEQLAMSSWEAPLVLTIPKGGITVAREIAVELGSPMEVILVRKLGPEENPGRHYGAVAENGFVVTSEPDIHELNLSRERVDEILGDGLRMIERRLAFYRPDHRLPDLKGRSVILVDDFADKGWTILAALERIKIERPLSVTLAMPMIPEALAAELRTKVDDLVCQHTPGYSGTVGDWYQDSRRVTDDEVLQLLESHDQVHQRTLKTK
jgi:putative phosphoribosyl transferase